MNDNIHKCRVLEENLTIKTGNSYVYSNIGFLICTELKLLKELCKYSFNRDKIYTTEVEGVMISKKTTSNNKNIIITNSYSINLWQRENVVVLKTKQINLDQIEKNDLIVLSLETAIQNITLLRTIQFKRVIFDNITNIKFENKLSCLQYDFKWYVVSTNKLIKYDYVFMNDITVNTVYDDRVIEKHQIRSKKPLVSLTLEGLVDEVIINNIDTYNINHIIKHLTDSSIKTEKNVIKCVMRKFQEQIKTIDTHEYCINNMYFANENDKLEKLDRLIKKRNEIHNKEKELIKRITKNELCFVCYNEIEVKSILRCCSNKICFQCLQKWMAENNSCPLCKKVPLDYFLVENPIIEQSNEDTHKITTSKSIFENFKILTRNILLSNDRKILLLGKGHQFLKRFADTLTDMGIEYVYLEGHSNRIHKQIANFEKKGLRVIVIPTSRIHSGIPMLGVTDIISISEDDCIDAYNSYCTNVTKNYTMSYM